MPEEPDKPMWMYHSIMGEIKIRLAYVSSVLAELPRALASPNAFLAVEGCYLKIRLTCELIALGALVLHEPYGMTPKLNDSWHASDTFKALLKLNPHAFPKAIIVGNSDKPGQFGFDLKTVMTANELYEIYGKCGGYLHRGVLKRFMNGEIKSYNIDILRDWAIKLATLLDYHAVVLNDDSDVIILKMTGGENGAVMVHRGSSNESFPPPSK